MPDTDALAADAARALRAPFVPDVIRGLAACEGYWERVWPQLALSVDTAGFLGSALYMADMALDAVEAVYEPLMTPEALRERGVSAGDLERIEAVLDVFHWLQPQLLLLLAALAEAWDRPRVGGQGRAEPRAPSDREERHLRTEVPFADASGGLLPEAAEALALPEAPELYRAVASWPGYLEAAWEELQHLVAYPDFRRRGRALYYYARSGSRFLAEPVEASEEALREAGVPDAALAQAKATIDAALPTLATMMMHCSAMRFALGLREREVVTQPR